MFYECENSDIWNYAGDTTQYTCATEKLLEIQIDWSELTFDEHISSICNKEGKIINALRRFVDDMSLGKRRMVVEAFIES